MTQFKLVSKFKPSGDQPKAIKALTQSLKANNPYQTLLGVTGSGKTFTMANVIQNLQCPTLVISHNKTLAAQLYSEFKAFFPQNAVEYFISHYDYYQPEAYIPQTDTYIEKDASINPSLERLRMSATSSLLERNDVIIVSSVSCIYGLGKPDDFYAMGIDLQKEAKVNRESFLEALSNCYYTRNEIELLPGTFRIRGESVDLYPSHLNHALRISFWDDVLENIQSLEPTTGQTKHSFESIRIYPVNPYSIPRKQLEAIFPKIQEELEATIKILEKENKLLEVQRLRSRIEYDLEMMREVGSCKGIENYSRYLTGRQAGQQPYCLLDYFPKPFNLIIDESHVTLPQIRAMYKGDRSRKNVLIHHGFRLPSALDNRPLKDDEFWEFNQPCLFVSATPTQFEIECSHLVTEQIIRPTGLLDPKVEIHPSKHQVEHLIGEIHHAIQSKQRVLVSTLTKRMSEDLSQYLIEMDIKADYLHSDITALDRVEILQRLRNGSFDVLVGVNLLREGLDLPEVGLVAILDADKEGFLRNETSLIQTIGRASRNKHGRSLLYADSINKTLQKVLDITQERREKQIAYNKKHNITPKQIQKTKQIAFQIQDKTLAKLKKRVQGNKPVKLLKELEAEMLKAADELNFEYAALLRDQIEAFKINSSKKQPKPSKKRT